MIHGSNNSGGGTAMKAGAESKVTMSGGGKGAFEPVMRREIVYGEVPDEGESLTLEGPLTVPDFLQTISLATGWNILWSDKVKGINLQFLINDVSPKEALKILKFNKVHYDWSEESRFLYVRTDEEWLEEEFGDIQEAEFQIHQVEVPYIESAVSSLLSGKGRILSDERTRRIYVWDTADNLDYITKTIAELDVPLEQESFRIQYAELPDIESVIGEIISSNGSLLSDARTGQIFVWDAPNKLDQMREAVRWLDVPVESRTFKIEHVNAEDLVDVLTEMLSERGMIQVDPRFNTLVITDISSRVERMDEIIATLDRALDTRTWVINYADIDFIYDQIDMIVPEQMGEIVVNYDVHQVTVTALPERLEKIAKLIETWDIKRKQVMIEAYIVEMSDEVEREFNINWSYFDSVDGNPVSFDGGSGFDPDSGSPVTFGQLPWAAPRYGNLELGDAGQITRPLLTNISGGQVMDYFGGKNLALTLDYLDQHNKATILASPRVTVQDGEEATFENAINVPFVSSTTFFDNSYTSNNNNNNRNFYNRNTNRIEFIDVGTILSVFPRVTDADNILLDIQAEDSTFVDKVIVANDQQSTVPQKTVRRAQTQLRVHSGETVVLGGLRRDRSADRLTKIPLLGDIPGIGRAFRYPNRQSANTTLMIFITTTIVDDFSHPEAETLVKAEDDIASAHHHNRKNLWGRLQSRFARGHNEIGVSIGQSGSMYSEGERVTMDDLRQVFSDLRLPSTVTVVLRKHPRAPQEVVTALMEMALEMDLKLEIDDSFATPIVTSPAES